MWSAAVLLPAFPGRSSTASGSPVPSLAVVGERPQRVVPEAALERRPGVLLVASARSPASRRCRPPAAVRRSPRGRGRAVPASCQTASPGGGPGGVDRRQRPGRVGGEQRRSCATRSGRTRPGRRRRARTCSTAMSARQSPPSASVTARSSSTFAGSCTARGARHGSQRPAEQPVQPAHPGRLQQRDPTGLRHDPARRRVDLDSRIQPGTLLHLEGAPRSA